MDKEGGLEKEVASLDGCFDERAEAVIMNISHRQPCVGMHRWINASLSWSKGNRAIALEAGEGPYTAAWGGGYGGIRYCRRCKRIDCIHWWDSEVVYSIKHHAYLSDKYVIAHCRFCDLRILRFSTRSVRASSEAATIIDEAALAQGRRPVSEGMYGSWYSGELSAAVSVILEEQGTEAARAYVAGIGTAQGGAGPWRQARVRGHKTGILPP